MKLYRKLVQKTLREGVTPYTGDRSNSYWRKKILSENDWVATDSGPTNSASQTFTYTGGDNLETGQPNTFSVSGLGGVETYPSTTTVNFGYGDISDVSTPSYGSLSIQGYAPPLSSVQRQTQQTENERIDAEIEKLEEQIKQLTAIEKQQIARQTEESIQLMDKNAAEWDAYHQALKDINAEVDASFELFEKEKSELGPGPGPNGEHQWNRPETESEQAARIAAGGHAGEGGTWAFGGGIVTVGETSPQLLAVIDRYEARRDKTAEKTTALLASKDKMQARQDKENIALNNKHNLENKRNFALEKQALRDKIAELENQRPINLQLDASQQAYSNLPYMNARVESAAGSNPIAQVPPDIAPYLDSDGKPNMDALGNADAETFGKVYQYLKNKPSEAPTVLPDISPAEDIPIPNIRFSTPTKQTDQKLFDPFIRTGVNYGFGMVNPGQVFSDIENTLSKNPFAGIDVGQTVSDLGGYGPRIGAKLLQAPADVLAARSYGDYLYKGLKPGVKFDPSFGGGGIKLGPFNPEAQKFTKWIKGLQGFDVQGQYFSPDPFYVKDYAKGGTITVIPKDKVSNVRGVKNPFGSSVSRGFDSPVAAPRGGGLEKFVRTSDVEKAYDAAKTFDLSTDAGRIAYDDFVKTAISKSGTAGKAARFASRAMPFVGAALGAADVADRISKGDVPGAALGAISMAPGPVGWAGLGLQLGYDAMMSGDFQGGQTRRGQGSRGGDTVSRLPSQTTQLAQQAVSRGSTPNRADRRKRGKKVVKESTWNRIQKYR